MEGKNGGILMICLKHGIVHDGKGHVELDCDLLVDEGKIIKIGKNLVCDQGEVMDVTGMHVMPGWIDPLSSWGCTAGRGQGCDNDEASDPMTPQLNVLYAFDPQSMNYQELYGYGITAVGVAPSNHNILGGTMAVLKSYGHNWSDMLVKEEVAMKGSVNQLVKDTYGKRNVAPMTKMGIFSALRELIQKTHSNLEEDIKDSKVKALKPVLEKKLPFFVSCNTKAETESLFHCLQEEEVDLVLANMYQLDTSLKNKDCSLILGDLTDGFNSLTGQVDFTALFDLIEAGQLVSLSAFGDAVSPGREILMWNAHHLLAQANRLERNFTSEDVLKMLTSIPAQLLQVEDRIGSLEVDKDADIIVWTGNPLETFQALPHTIIINGQLVKGGC